MKIVMRLIFLSLLLAGNIYAGNNLTSGFEFLRTDFSARTAATANAFTAIRGDVNGLLTNPAGMSYAETKQFAFNYTNFLLDISGGYAGYVHLFPNLGVLSAAIIYMDYGEFEETDMDAVSTGNAFSANEMALAVGFSNHLDKHFSYGVNLKYIFSKIQNYNASAVALDFGLMYEAPFQDDLFFAFTLANVGTNFEYYGEVKESLPLSMRLGLTKKLAHLPLELGISLNDFNVEAAEFFDRIKRFSVGGEFRISDALRMRMGYNNDLRSGLETTTNDKFGGISAGLGFYIKKFRIDYAFSNYGAIGNVHRFGIQGTLGIQ